MNLFVARLSSSTTDDDLRETFSAFGEVSSAKIIMDRETGNSKCFGFVEMPDSEEANKAIEALNDTELDGKTIVVKEANPPKQDRPNRDFNRRDGGQRGGYNRGGNRNYQSRDDNRRRGYRDRGDSDNRW